MRVTDRDVQLVRDIALSHVLSRDQVLDLGYFGSLTRVNTRLRSLRDLNLIQRLDTPFFQQSLYAAGTRASDVVSERLGCILAGRSASPRFIRHALMVTNTRIVLARKGAEWRFEQQALASFRFRGREYTVRPDGLAKTRAGVLAVEVDLGHVSPSKFAEKLLGYDAFLASKQCLPAWQTDSFSLLTLTTGTSRAQKLRSLMPRESALSMHCQTFEQFGLYLIGGWS